MFTNGWGLFETEQKHAKTSSDSQQCGQVPRYTWRKIKLVFENIKLTCNNIMQI